MENQSTKTRSCHHQIQREVVSQYQNQEENQDTKVIDLSKMKLFSIQETHSWRIFKMMCSDNFVSKQGSDLTVVSCNNRLL